MPSTVRAKHLSSSSSSDRRSSTSSSSKSNSSDSGDGSSTSSSAKTRDIDSSSSSQAQDSEKKRRHSSPTVIQRRADKKQHAMDSAVNEKGGRPSQTSASTHDDTVVQIPSILTETGTDAPPPSHGEPNLLVYRSPDAPDAPEATEQRVSSKWVTLSAAIGGSAAVGVLFGKLFHWHETEKVAAIIGGSAALGIALWGLGQAAMACRNNAYSTQPQPSA